MQSMTRVLSLISAFLILLTNSYVIQCESRFIADTSFEQQLVEFPESYHDKLKQIHELHPNWIFEAVAISDPWPTAISQELVHEDTNLIPNSSNRSWIRNYIVYDGKEWVPASRQIVEYYMDPRNFLNEKDIFQFEKLSYDETTQNETGIRAVFGSNQALLDMTSFVLQAAEEANVNAYFLASRIKQEISESSTGITNSARGDISVSYPPLTAGGISPCFMTPQEQLSALLSLDTRNKQQEAWLQGLESVPQISLQLPTARYYNVYNIGATPDPAVVDGARINAIRFAMTTNEKYDLPWTSTEKAVVGGAKFIAEKYIAKGQDTMYFQKFAVIGDASILYIHQYMQNIQAAYSEAQRYYTAYSEALMLEDSFVFSIPVYKDMPASPSIKPDVVPAQLLADTLPGSIGEAFTVSDNHTYQLRKEPLTQSDTIAQAESGMTYVVEALIVGEETPYGNLWYQVTSNGQTGYIIVDLNGQILPQEVTFDTRGGNEIPIVYVKTDMYVPKPDNPIKQGYLFMGWFKDPLYKEPWSFESDAVAFDMVLYAKWIGKKMHTLEVRGL